MSGCTVDDLLSRAEADLKAIQLATPSIDKPNGVFSIDETTLIRKHLNNTGGLRYVLLSSGAFYFDPNNSIPKEKTLACGDMFFDFDLTVRGLSNYQKNPSPIFLIFLHLKQNKKPIKETLEIVQDHPIFTYTISKTKELFPFLEKMPPNIAEALIKNNVIPPDSEDFVEEDDLDADVCFLLNNRTPWQHSIKLSEKGLFGQTRPTQKYKKEEEQLLDSPSSSY